MCNISHTDCLILFSFPRYSLQDKVTAEMAYNAKADIILITNEAPTLDATVLLTVPVDSNTFFNSMIAHSLYLKLYWKQSVTKQANRKKCLVTIDKYLSKLATISLAVMSKKYHPRERS